VEGKVRCHIGAWKRSDPWFPPFENREKRGSPPDPVCDMIEG